MNLVPFSFSAVYLVYIKSHNTKTDEFYDKILRGEGSQTKHNEVFSQSLTHS